MPDAALKAAIDRFPESRELIMRLAGRSAPFHALCSDLQAVVLHLATLHHDDDRREHERLRAELEVELSEWLGTRPLTHID